MGMIRLKHLARLPALISLLFVVVKQCLSDPEEFRLYEDLRRNYNPLERPVQNASEALIVKLSLILQQIVNLDEKNQILETNVWLQYEWYDYKLQWKPEEYGGVVRVRFPAGSIWSPDVLLYNSADTNFDSTYPSDLLVYSNGLINWIPPGILKSSCKIDITWFPFDDQSCYLKFGPWTHHGYEIDLQPADPTGMDTSEYLENGEWLLMSTPVQKKIKRYECCEEPYPTLWFFINMRRRTLYYGFNLIIPSLLISLMTVLGFTLPPDAGEKITLEITILLSVCLFLSLVAEMTPPTSEAVPLIGTFFSCCMLVVSASVVFTVVVLNLHYRTPDTHEMTPFVRQLLLNWIPWLLMMRRPGRRFHRNLLLRADSDDGKDAPPPASQMHKSASGGFESESLMRNVRSLEDGANRRLNFARPVLIQPPPLPATVHRPRTRPTSVDLDARVTNCLKPLLAANVDGMEAIAEASAASSGERATLLLLQRIHAELKFVTRRMEKDDADEDAQNDWKFAAMVVDRLCLIVFSTFIVASTCAIMFSAPHLIA